MAAALNRPRFDVTGQLGIVRLFVSFWRTMLIGPSRYINMAQSADAGEGPELSMWFRRVLEMNQEFTGCLVTGELFRHKFSRFRAKAHPIFWIGDKGCYGGG